MIACSSPLAVNRPHPLRRNGLPIIGNASDRARLSFNFSAAANFVNVVQPEGSSLFLYPTNEIANLDNPFSTGLPHPGGAAFAIDSAQARDILTWAKGLRPDAEGFARHWLVAGDFAAAALTDPTAVDEANVAPAILDPSGASFFNNGAWDGLFAEDSEVDLNSAFPRAQTSGRVAYVLNTSPNPIAAQLTVRSPNAVKMYVGAQPVLQTDDAANGVSGFAVFAPFSGDKANTRVLLKVFQRADDRDFRFEVQLQDEFGNLLTDASGELVIKLGPNGGI